MTHDIHAFIRRFLMHVLPQGCHRIRYDGWLTKPARRLSRACAIAGGTTHS
jgi:hypothetical protein